jgi:hypothetical protein
MSADVISKCITRSPRTHSSAQKAYPIKLLKKCELRFPLRRSIETEKCFISDIHRRGRPVDLGEITAETHKLLQEGFRGEIDWSMDAIISDETRFGLFDDSPWMWIQRGIYPERISEPTPKYNKSFMAWERRLDKVSSQNQRSLTEI